MEVDCKIPSSFSSDVEDTSAPRAFYAPPAPSSTTQALPATSFDAMDEKSCAVNDNLHRFISHTTPVLPMRSLSRDPTTPNGFCFPLSGLWSYYDQPYGHEVPLMIDNRQVYAFFVPYLSAVQLFGKEPNSPALFEYFEQNNPGQRIPLVDKIQQLGLSCDFLIHGNSMLLDCSRSWFSIAWYPILCDHYTNRFIGGCFLTYHKFELVGECPLLPLLCDEAERATMLNSFDLATKATLGGEHFDATMAMAEDESDVEVDCWCDIQPDEVFLSFEGCLPYKVRPETWFSRSAKPSLSALSLQMGAHKLLVEAQVSHPDFLHMCKRR